MRRGRCSSGSARSSRAGSTSSSSGIASARRSGATRRSSISRGGSGSRSSPPTACATRARRTRSSTTSSRASATTPRSTARAGFSRRSASGTSGAPPRWRELFADLPEALDAALELSRRLDFTLADLGYRFPDYPLPPGRDAILVPAPGHLERRPRALPPADGEGPGADREGAGDDREARSGRLLPDRLGHRALLHGEPHPRAGPRLGRQQRRLLRALDHGGRPGEDGAPLRALPLRGARRVAGHRPRPALGRPAREGHPARLREVRAARRRHDGQRHHVPRPLLGARGRQGARLLAGAGGRALQAARRLELRRDPRPAGGARGGDPRGRARSGGAARAALPAPLSPDPEPPAPPRPALGRDRRRGRAPGRGRAARAGLDAGARRRAVGQGRLRGPGDREGGPPRPRDARRDRGGDPDDLDAREASRWTWRTCRRTIRRSTRC